MLKIPRGKCTVSTELLYIGYVSILYFRLLFIIFGPRNELRLKLEQNCVPLPLFLVRQHDMHA